MNRKLLAGLLVLLFVPCVVGQTKIHIGKPHGHALNITTTSLPAGQTTIAYSKQVLASGGTPPYTFTQPSGTLPTGLIIVGTGVISGTPTVAGIYSFVVHVVDNVAATDNQSLSITITATAPISPVSITTSSVPAGTVGVAYTTALAATGGTNPDTWSIPTGGGVTPPGVVLASTGVISGTPTAPGTYSFTARVTDSTSPAQTADRAFGLVVAAGTPTHLFTDGFESGNFAAWSGAGGWPTNNPFIATSPSPVHSGTYSYGQHYYICGDPANPACGAASQDSNRYLVKMATDFGQPSGMTHFFMRGYVYFKSPTTPDTVITGRKLIWVGDETSSGGSGGIWNIMFSGITGSGGALTPTHQHLTFGSQGAACHGSSPVDWMAGVPPLDFDVWYSLEIEVQTNTPVADPGPFDGIFRVWVDGALVYQNTTIKINGNCTTPFRYFSVGRQTNRGSYMVVDEYRYWDDVVISTSYIGP
jgi:hypothetical protein